MTPPHSHLRLLAPPLRLLLGAMWRIAGQQAQEHYGMLEEFITVATESVPELLSNEEKNVLLLALRNKEVHGQEFNAALELLLRDFLSRLQERFPVPDFTKVSALLQDDWLKDCLQEVTSQELKELLNNHSTAHRLTCSGETRPGSGPDLSKTVLKSARQQLQCLLKIPEPELTNQKQDQLQTPSEPHQLPRATSQSPPVVKPLLAAANQTPVFTLLNILPNQTVLLIPTNQSMAAVLPTNQEQPACKKRNSKVLITELTNQEPPLQQAECSDQLEPSSSAQMDQSVPSSSAVTDQSEAATTEDSVSQNSRRLPQKCPQCHKCFIYRNQVLKHLETSRCCSSAPRPIRSLRCFQCPAACQTKAELRAHLRTHRAQVPVLGLGPRDQTGPDPTSRDKTGVDPNLRPRDQTRPDPRPKTRARTQRAPEEAAEKPLSFCCSLCQQCFKTQGQLLTHLDLHLVQGDTPRYECLYCDQSFTGSTHLRLHQRAHKQRPFTCSVCGKAYASADGLKSHRKLHGERRFLCHTCGRSFVSRASLRSHSRAHSDDVHYTCALCGRGFKYHAGLKVHLRRHLGEKPYSCSVCGKSFISSGELQPHMRIHTGEKPYSCKECGKTFTVSSQLRIHLRMHTGEKPHSCPECGKEYIRKGELERHLRGHFNQRPFNCLQCPKAYTCKSHLRRHLQSHKDQD